jgi:hypothetical protein
VPGGLHQRGADPLRAGLGDVAAPGELSAGVLRGHQPGTAHEPPVSDRPSDHREPAPDLAPPPPPATAPGSPVNSPGPIQPGQTRGIPPVSLDAIPAALGNQRRSDHLTGHPQAPQQPVQLITTRTRLITGPQRTDITHRPINRRTDASPPEDPVDVGNLLIRSHDPHHDRILRRVHPQTDQITTPCQTRHDGRLLPVCGTIPPAMASTIHRGTTHQTSQRQPREPQPAVPC